MHDETNDLIITNNRYLTLFSQNIGFKKSIIILLVNDFYSLIVISVAAGWSNNVYENPGVYNTFWISIMFICMIISYVMFASMTYIFLWMLHTNAFNI